MVVMLGIARVQPLAQTGRGTAVVHRGSFALNGSSSRVASAVPGAAQAIGNADATAWRRRITERRSAADAVARTLTRVGRVGAARHDCELSVHHSVRRRLEDPSYWWFYRCLVDGVC